MTRYAEDFCADIVLTAKAAKPISAAAQYRRCYSDGLNIIYGAGAAIQTRHCREWRFQTRLPFLTLQALQQRGLLAADVGACAAMNVYIEFPTGTASVWTKQSGLIGFVDCAFERHSLVVKLSPNVNIGGVRTHSEASNEAAFDQLVRIVS